MKDIEYISGAICEDFLIRENFPNEYVRLKQLESDYKALKSQLLSKAKKKNR